MILARGFPKRAFWSSAFLQVVMSNSTLENVTSWTCSRISKICPREASEIVISAKNKERISRDEFSPNRFRKVMNCSTFRMWATRWAESIWYPSASKLSCRRSWRASYWSSIPSYSSTPKWRWNGGQGSMFGLRANMFWRANGESGSGSSLNEKISAKKKQNFV